MKNVALWTLRILAALIVLVVCFYAEEYWRGQHAWEKYRHEREAKGDSFEWSSVVPAPVPDSENFAAIPLFAELFQTPATDAQLNAIKWPDCPKSGGNWSEGRTENLAAWQACLSNDNLLVALAKYDPILNEIAEASRRPKCQFPVRYEDHINALLPHLSALRALARLYRLRALAELAAGHTDAAFADVQTGLRLAAAMKDEPILISFFVRTAILNIIIQPVWEGLAAHRWSDHQLATLQTEFEKTDQIDPFAKAMRGERLFAYHFVRWLMEKPAERLPGIGGMTDASVPTATKLVAWSIPTGWIYQNMLQVDEVYTATYLPAIDFDHRVFNPSSIRKIDDTIRSIRTTPYTVLCKMLLPAITAVPKKAAQSQTAVDEASVACALERYRLAHGELPEKLDALVPQFLAKIPHDVIDGQPLRYRRAAADAFVLYSVGWNEVDDGGQIAWTTGHPPRQDLDRGDWVWQSQPSASERK